MSLTFGIIAALVTAVAIWVGYLNGQAKDEQARLLQEEIKENEKLVKRKKSYETRISEAHETFLADLEGIKVKLDERDEKELKKGELKVKLTALKSEVASLEQDKADFQTDIPDLGEVDRLVKNLKDTKAEITQLEGSAAELEADAAKLSAEISQQSERISKNNKWIKNHLEYKSQDGLSATIKAVYNDWGFVILSSGDAQGVTPRSRLVVKRGEEVIGELMVKTATNKAATAEIIYSKMKEGHFVQVGDSVHPFPVVKEEVKEEAPQEKVEAEAEEVVEEAFSF